MNQEYKILLFGSYDCEECAKQKLQLSDYNYDFYDIDEATINNEENTEDDFIEAYSKYDIEEIPSIIIINNKNKYLKHIGVLSKNKIKQFINS